MHVFKSVNGKEAVYNSYDNLLKLWQVPVEQADLETSYGKTHVILVGDKKQPSVILFHGVGDNAAIMWINNAKELARHFYLIAVDIMGGAGKSCPDHQYNKDFDLCIWFTDLLRALDLVKADIVGVSYGCYLGQHFLHRCPDRVKKVVGIAGYPNVQGYKMGLMKRMLSIFLPVMLFPSEKKMDKLFNILSGPHPEADVTDTEIYRHWRLLINHYRNNSLRFHKRLAFSVTQYKNISSRLMFLIGEHDSLANFPASRRAIQDLGLNLKIIKNGYHTMNYYQAAEVNSDIISFLKQGR